MERKKSIIGTSVEINGITVIPLMNISVWCTQLNGSLSLYGSVRPSLVILISKEEIKAFTINSEDVNMVQLMQENPELEVLLDSI